jgi:HAE1 family hydrophobic/amphiphilic exporter-1
VTAYLLESGGPDGGVRSIQLQLQGDESGTLARLAGQSLAIVRETPGAVDVGLSSKGQKPELRVDVNRGLAARSG